MPAKKKSKAPKSKSKTTKTRAAPRKSASKSTSSKKSLKRKAGPPKRTAKRRTRRKAPSVNVARELQQEIRNRRLRTAGTPEARQSDFRGLSRAEEADSESVDELVEEGNIFEAGAVAGVEEADDSDEKEVRTHELPEDDVPDEYLEKD